MTTDHLKATAPHTRLVLWKESDGSTITHKNSCYTPMEQNSMFTVPRATQKTTCRCSDDTTLPNGSEKDVQRLKRKQLQPTIGRLVQNPVSKHCELGEV